MASFIPAGSTTIAALFPHLQYICVFHISQIY